MHGKVKYGIDVCAYTQDIYYPDQEFIFDVSFKKVPSFPVFTCANSWHPSPCSIEHVIYYDGTGPNLTDYSTHFKFISSWPCLQKFP